VLTIASFISPDIVADVLQIISHGHHELVCVCEVNDAMVIPQHQPQNVTDGDGIIAVRVRDHGRLLEDAAHAQNRHLGLQDNRPGGPPLPMIRFKTLAITEDAPTFTEKLVFFWLPAKGEIIIPLIQVVIPA
jgi:hypothetical protein